MRLLNETHRLFGVLDKRLGTHEYMAGDYSIADIATWPWISRFEYQTMDLKEFPNVKRLANFRSPGQPFRPG